MKKTLLTTVVMVVVFCGTQAMAALQVSEITLADWNANFGSTSGAVKIFESRARYGGTGYRIGLRNLSTGIYDVTGGTGYNPWPNGSAWDFTVGYNLSNVSLKLDGINTISRSATGVVGDIVVKVNAQTDGGSVSLTNVALNGQSLGMALESLNKGGEKFFWIRGVDLSSGLTLAGDATLSWGATTPAQEGLKFEVVAFQIPEPATMLLLGLGGILLRKRR